MKRGCAKELLEAMPLRDRQTFERLDERIFILRKQIAELERQKKKYYHRAKSKIYYQRKKEANAL